MCWPARAMTRRSEPALALFQFVGISTAPKPPVPRTSNSVALKINAEYSLDMGGPNTEGGSSWRLRGELRRFRKTTFALAGRLINYISIWF